MPKQTMLQSHYLPLDACVWMGHHAIVMGLAGVLSFGVVFALLRRRFGRGGMDVVVTAVFLAAIAVFSAACLYLLATRPGYRVFHPGF